VNKWIGGGIRLRKSCDATGVAELSGGPARLRLTSARQAGSLRCHNGLHEVEATGGVKHCQVVISQKEVFRLSGFSGQQANWRTQPDWSIAVSETGNGSKLHDGCKTHETRGATA
jgi:hypothetical protein